MKAERFVKLLDSDFFTGVPDSQLKPLCDYLMRANGISKRHVICANEGNCVALAAGHYLASGKTGVVYLQNSGVGNIINPVTSLMSDAVYGIPCVYVVGWRGEPNVHDEPQHAQMGGITERLLEDVGIEVFVIGKDTSEDEVERKLKEWQPLLQSGRSVAFLVRKGALEYDEPLKYENGRTLSRERAVDLIAKAAAGDPLVCTTGKASRELFEIRERAGESHASDFLTVGSMGHSSSIALGVALERPDLRVWCVDGDGAAVMHLGALAAIGGLAPENYIHIVLNNGAHESVGGMPTAASSADLCAAATACGYRSAVRADSEAELTKALDAAASAKGPCFVEVMVSVGSREDLGRPTVSPADSKTAFMEELNRLSDRT